MDLVSKPLMPGLELRSTEKGMVIVLVKEDLALAKEDASFGYCISPGRR